jgi:hypothetical protein
VGVTRGVVEMGDSSIGETELPEVAIVNIVKCVLKFQTKQLFAVKQAPGYQSFLQRGEGYGD